MTLVIDARVLQNTLVSWAIRWSGLSLLSESQKKCSLWQYRFCSILVRVPRHLQDQTASKLAIDVLEGTAGAAAPDL